MSEHQNKLAPLYESAKESRDGALMKARELERKVTEAQKRFEEAQQNKQDEIDELSKNIAQQKQEINQLKEKIENAKAEMAKYVEEGIQCEPIKSTIFPSFEIDKSLLDLPKTLIPNNNEQNVQLQSQPQTQYQPQPQAQYQSQAQPQTQAYQNFQNIQFPSFAIPQQQGIGENSHYKSCLDQINFLLQQAQSLSIDQDFTDKNKK